ncbi:MAG: hypothetical protein OXF25_05700 [Cyanobacteria bacterium MAG CAR3_bin_5]|nr:hypothetical protein [Cyanobacteria bacterium MAG CAR3_bin_5]
MTHLWFPAAQDTLSQGAKPGHWQGHSAQAVGELASNLSYDGIITRINSLPTPWSRVIQMEQAITNRDYPTRDQLLDELFGCLAVVGLSDLYNLKLQAKILQLEDLCNDPETAVRRFATSLRENKPKASQSVLRKPPKDISPWDRLMIFMIEDARTHQSQPIGFASPSSILCPAAQLRWPIAGVPWVSEGRFSDPTPHLSLQQHKQPLANWLNQLSKTILNSQPKVNSSLAENLCGLLGEFIDRLKVQLSIRPEKGEPIPNASNIMDGLLAHSAAPVKSEDSLCRVILKDKQDENIKPVILVDPLMPGQLQKAESEIQLYEHDTLTTICGDAERLRERHKTIKVVTPDDLFLPNLTLLPGGHALCHSWLPGKLTARLEVGNQEDTTPLLPFSVCLQELFSSRELKEMVSLAVDHGQGCLVVGLVLKLEGFGEYRLERSYPLKEAALLGSIPVMAIWPSIPAGYWRKYWIFSQMVDGLSVDKTADWEGPHLVEFGSDQVRYFCSTSFPDLLNVSVDGKPGGVIPLESPERIKDTVESWDVGLDFGTSFTNWAIWDHHEKPCKLPLQSALWPVTAANDQLQREFLNRYFLPQEMHPEDDNPPTSTSLSVVGCKKEKLDSKNPPELFHETRLHIPQEDEAFKSHLRTGFKWEHPELQQPFLRQLALMISTHAVRCGAGGITWRLSYPTAFPNNTKRNYERFWRELTEELKLISGLDHKLNSHPLLSEAVAFACCLADDSKIFQHTACMDIGGRTTDISLWQGSRLIHQVSVPFAGQHICTKILDYRREFASDLLDKSLTSMQRSSGQTMESNRLSLIDTHIRFKSEILLKKELPNRRSPRLSERDRTLEQFISLMALATGGLYYYLGFIIRCLHKQRILSKLSCMSVYVGGNGGKLLRWLDPICQFDEDSQINIWLSRIQSAAINLSSGKSNEREGTTYLSEQFKNEVAIGLVVDKPHLRGFNSLESNPFSGESLCINGYEFAAEQPIDLSKIGHDEPVTAMKLLNLKELQRYVQSMVQAMDGIKNDLQMDPLVKASDLEGSFGEKVLAHAQNLCDQHLGDPKNPRKLGDFLVEPGFCLGLRALVEVLAKEWAEDRL